MGAYGTPERFTVNNENQNRRWIKAEAPPRVRDYLLWIFLPIVLSLFTFGIGGLVFIIAWATDKHKLARANFCRAILVILGIIATIALIIIAEKLGYIEYKTPWWK